MVVRGSKDVGSSAKVLGKNSTSHSSYHSRSNGAYKLPRIRFPIETLKAPSPAEKSWRFSPTSLIRTETGVKKVSVVSKGWVCCLPLMFGWERKQCFFPGNTSSWRWLQVSRETKHRFWGEHNLESCFAWFQTFCFTPIGVKMKPVLASALKITIRL